MYSCDSVSFRNSLTPYWKEWASFWLAPFLVSKLIIYVYFQDIDVNTEQNSFKLEEVKFDQDFHMEKSEFQTFWKTAIHRYFNCECFQSKWYYAIVLLEINTPQSQSYQNLELKFFNASFPNNSRARFVKLTKLALYSSNQFLAAILQIMRRFLMTCSFSFFAATDLKKL